MFRLTAKEAETMVSQNAIPSKQLLLFIGSISAVVWPSRNNRDRYDQQRINNLNKYFISLVNKLFIYDYSSYPEKTS